LSWVGRVVGGWGGRGWEELDGEKIVGGEGGGGGGGEG